MPPRRRRGAAKKQAVSTESIKLEITPSAEDEKGTDIQNYINSFNKEIQIIPDAQGTEAKTELVQSDGNNTYYITETGQCYFQADSIPNGQVVTVVSGTDDSRSQLNENSVQNAADSDKIISSISETGQIVLGETTYQTVTVVPSESENGELSYVLIVQNPESEKDKVPIKVQAQEVEDQDLTVYDFDDGEQVNEARESGTEDKKKIIKVVPSRKSQNASQAHMCTYCNYITPKRYLLARHLKSHSEERPHKCSICERGFKTMASLQNHVNTHTGTKPHKCKFCENAFTTSGELVRHVRYKHTHEKPHKCTMCDYASVELSKMRNHMRCHTGERPYQCPHCTYASPDTFKLKRHLRIHTGERPYVCNVCGHRFTQSNSLKAHMLVHCVDGEKPVFQCDMCPTTCGRKTDLRIHMQKLHTSDRIFTCRRCGKQFPDRYTFKVHNKTHDGEKCWKCDYCPYASVSGRHLESHMLVHTDQKPYHCEHCDQKFRQKQLLKRHQNLYHNPSYVAPKPKEKTHECSECKRAFRHKGNLIRHMSMHDPDSRVNQTTSALKLGRQKRIRLTNSGGGGLRIKELIDDDNDQDGEDDEDDEDDCGSLIVRKNDIAKSLVSVEADDGERYVLLEVIPYSEGDNNDDGENDQRITVNVTTEDNAAGVRAPTATMVATTDRNSGSAANADEQYILPDKNVEFDQKSDIITLTTTQTVVTTAVIPVIRNKETLNDLENCFGFVESDEEPED